MMISRRGGERQRWVAPRFAVVRKGIWWLDLGPRCLSSCFVYLNFMDLWGLGIYLNFIRLLNKLCLISFMLLLNAECVCAVVDLNAILPWDESWQLFLLTQCFKNEIRLLSGYSFLYLFCFLSRSSAYLVNTIPSKRNTWEKLSVSILQESPPIIF